MFYRNLKNLGEVRKVHNINKTSVTKLAFLISSQGSFYDHLPNSFPGSRKGWPPRCHFPFMFHLGGKKAGGREDAHTGESRVSSLHCSVTKSDFPFEGDLLILTISPLLLKPATGVAAAIKAAKGSCGPGSEAPFLGGPRGRGLGAGRPEPGWWCPFPPAGRPHPPGAARGVGGGRSSLESAARGLVQRSPQLSLSTGKLTSQTPGFLAVS